jgi:hypothetical protein
MRRRSAWLLILLLAPLLLGWSDPAHDLRPCNGDTGAVASAPIDIVDALGTSAEEGEAIRFRITFAQPLPVPDEQGKPLRVDVLLRDPSVPALTAGPYLRLNRIVRFDAVAEPGLLIMLLPERSATPFAGGVDARDDTLTLTFPARMVMQDPDLAGFDLRRLRWTVVARDERTCDILGGRSEPTRRLKIVGDRASPAPATSPGTASSASDDHPLMSTGFLLACVLAIGVGGGAGMAAARWRRRAG